MKYLKINYAKSINIFVIVNGTNFLYGAINAPYLSIIQCKKTSTKVVHKNISQGCIVIKRSGSDISGHLWKIMSSWY